MNENKTGKGREAEAGSGPKPDQETLHKTDPQRNMEGPVSTSMDKIGDAFNTGKTQKEADRERDEHM